MSQSAKASLIETVINIGIGFVISTAVGLMVYPMFGHAFSITENVALTAIFTVISIIRSYAVRRVSVKFFRG